MAIESYRVPQVRKLIELVNDNPGITKAELMQHLRCDQHNFMRILDACRLRNVRFDIRRSGRDGRISSYYPINRMDVAV